MKRTLGILFVVVASAANLSAQGTILWDESVNGPLSNDAGSPTSLSSLSLGINSIIGTVQLTPVGAGWGRDDDLLTFTIPTGMQVTSLYATIDQSIAVWLGAPAFLDEYGFAITSSNGDLLPNWGLVQISPGNYGMYISNNDFQPFPTSANYRLDFFVQAVPEPSSFALLVASGAAFWFWRKQK